MLDDIDKRLLSELQKNAHLTAMDLSALLNLSASQVGRRKQRLEADGYITNYSARPDPEKVGLHIQAFVQVQMANYSPEQAKNLSRLLHARPEVVSGWTLTGNADYLLRVYCRDIKELNELIHDVLLSHPAVARVQSQIVMDQIKQDAPLPI